MSDPVCVTQWQTGGRVELHVVDQEAGSRLVAYTATGKLSAKMMEQWPDWNANGAVVGTPERTFMAELEVPIGPQSGRVTVTALHNPDPEADTTPMSAARLSEITRCAAQFETEHGPPEFPDGAVYQRAELLRELDRLRRRQSA